MSEALPIGIIANPASGKDIRRLVGHASVVDNNEKVRIVRRALLALDAAGATRVLAMPDYYATVARAAADVELRLTIAEVVIERTAGEADTTASAAAMEQAGVAAIITLGGDGTNRAAVLGARNTPLIAISTGTNNVFPTLVEGAAAGLAAAALALGLVRADEVAPRCKLIEVCGEGVRSLALIDVAVLDPGPVGARAVWHPEALHRLLLTRASAAYQGLAAIGGLLRRLDDADEGGLDLRFGESGLRLIAPLAPGRFDTVCVSAWDAIADGEARTIAGPCLLAFDGERTQDVRAGRSVTAVISRSGPPVVDVRQAVQLAAKRGLLRARN